MKTLPLILVSLLLVSNAANMSNLPENDNNNKLQQKENKRNRAQQSQNPALQVVQTNINYNVQQKVAAINVNEDLQQIQSSLVNENADNTIRSIPEPVQIVNNPVQKAVYKSNSTTTRKNRKSSSHRSHRRTAAKQNIIVKQEPKSEISVKAEEERKPSIPLGKSVEIIRGNQHTITRTTFNYGDVIHVYTMVQHSWGGLYYFHEDTSISCDLYLKETNRELNVKEETVANSSYLRSV